MARRPISMYCLWYKNLLFLYKTEAFWLMAKTAWCFKPFCLIWYPRFLIERFVLSGRGVFLLWYSRYLAKIHVWISSTLFLISRFGNTSILFPFFIFFLFLLTFLEDIISKVVAARQMYATKEGIKPSRESFLTFSNGLLLVTSILIQ